MAPKRAPIAPASCQALSVSKRLRHLYRRKTVVEGLIRSLLKYDRAARSGRCDVKPPEW